ncbi:hypothetical protein B0H13DRAFT_2305276 [Mycena leptocephala]|nr:hypothetical protein B0H13DRAFT_2305276 [Mycena leptocephala]
MSTSSRSSPYPRSSSPTSDPPVDHQQKEARLKRRIAELEGQLASTNKVARPTVEKSYKTMGRAICKVVSLFDPIQALVGEYDRRQELEDKREEEGDDTPVSHTLEQNRLYRGFQELQRYVPAIKQALVSFDPTELDAMYSKLQKGATGAHGDDVSSVRAAMAGFVGKGAKDPLVPSSRANRGLESAVTGPLLFPVDYDYNDLLVRAKVINGDEECIVDADKWPRGLYQNGMYDPASPDKGLFKSMSLLQTYLHIFTAPKSAVKLQDEADNERIATADSFSTENVPPSRNAEPPAKRRKVAAAQSSKKSVASKIRMRRVTPRSIAYAAVHHRFALSDAPTWNEVDGDFDYILYYYNILDWFENVGPIGQKEVDELLAWWDQRVFKNSGRSVPEPSRGSSSIAAMRERRAARELNV